MRKMLRSSEKGIGLVGAGEDDAAERYFDVEIGAVTMVHVCCG